MNIAIRSTLLARLSSFALTAPAAAAPMGASVGRLISRLEQEHSLVIVRLPGMAADSGYAGN